VPPGALVATRSVTLKRAEPSGFYGQDSRAYVLEMGDGGHCKALDVSFSGLGGPDRSLDVALGDVLADGSGSVSRPVPRLVSGSVISGNLYVSIPPTTTCSSSDDAKQLASGGLQAESFTLELAPDWITTTRGQFTIHYPADPSVDQIVGFIFTNAQTAYSKLAALGFSFDKSFNFPISINLVHGLGQRDGESGLPLSGKADGYININLDRCTPDNMDNIRATIGHEFFHLVQNVYDPRTAIEIRHPSTTPYFLWLGEASSVWFEADMLDNPDYVSPIFVLNIDMMPNGLETYGNNRTEAQNRGYWASGFLRSLRSQRTAGFLTSIWEQARAQGQGAATYSDLGALISGVDSAEATARIWRGFIEQFVSNTTGYLNWPQPASNSVLYPDGSKAVSREAVMEPFSGQKFSIIFRNTVRQDFQIVALSNSQDITFALYQGTNAGPFQFVSNLTPGAPRTVTARQGDISLVALVNSSTQSPYKTASNATVLVGSTSHRDCIWCPAVPADAIVEELPDNNQVRWLYPSSGVLAGRAMYYDSQLTNVQSAWCYPESGIQQAQYNYYSDGTLQTVEYFDADGKPDGVKLDYYQNGHLWVVTPYSHGLIHGVNLIYWENGNIHYRYDKFTNGVLDGYLTTYDESGLCVTKQKWVNGSPTYQVGCP
jgi:hypothetical protein